MEQIHEAFYLETLFFHTSAVSVSVDELNKTFKAYSDRRAEQAPRKHNRMLVLIHAQNIVNHAAAISRLLWPSSKKKSSRERAHSLKQAFGIGDSSQLKNRDLRNAIEHFDERLDEHVASGTTQDIMPIFVGSRAELERRSVVGFRGYIIDEHVCKILNQEVALHPLIKEITDLHQQVVESVNNGGRLPST